MTRVALLLASAVVVLGVVGCGGTTERSAKDVEQAFASAGLTGAWKVGAWHHTGWGDTREMSYRKLLVTAIVFDNARDAGDAGGSLIRASVAAVAPMWTYLHPQSRYRPKFASLRVRNVYVVYDRRNSRLSSMVMAAARKLR